MNKTPELRSMTVLCSGTFRDLAPNLVDLQIAVQKLREGTWDE